MKEKIRTSKFLYPSLKIPSYEDFFDVSLISALGKTKRLTVSGTQDFIFGIRRQDRIYPLYIIGKRGVGKSKLLESLVRQDIFFDYGLCYFDFKGDNFNNFLNFIPKNKIDKVCLIDLGKIYNFVFNPLKNVNEKFRLHFIKDLICLFKDFLINVWDYHYEVLFNNIFLALFSRPDLKFTDLLYFLKDENFRNKILNYVKNNNVLNYWQNDFSLFYKRHNFSYLFSKLVYLLDNKSFSNIFNYVESKIDFDKLVKNKNIILINLNKTKFNDELIHFIGSLFLLKLKEIGFYRSYFKKDSKELFYVYLEDFYNLNECLMFDFISNFREYGFSINLSHQYLSQISEKLKDLIFNSSGHFIIFKLTGDDALKIKNEFSGLLDVKDFTNLNLKEFYVKITVDKEMQEPFFAEALTIMPFKNRSYKNLIIFESRKKYGL